MKLVSKNDNWNKAILPLKLNLQHFAEQGGDGGEEGGDQQTEGEGQKGEGQKGEGQQGEGQQTEGSQQQDEGKKAKGNTFTQDDVNAIASKEAKKAQEKLLKQLGVKDIKSAKDGLEQFKKQQDAQKTDAEKAIERAKELESTSNEQATTIDTLQTQLAAMKADVNPDSLDDVVVLAKNGVTDDIDIEQSIKNVLDKYPHFKRQQQQNLDDDEGKKQKQKPEFMQGDHKDKSKKTTADMWKDAFNWG